MSGVTSTALIMACIVWFVGTIFTLVFGFFDWNDRRGVLMPGRDAERRDAARRVLLCWAWPLLVLPGMARAASDLLRDALGGAR